jgi:hypothetical protein
MKRIFLALALLPVLSAPAMAEDGKAHVLQPVQLEKGIDRPCEQGREYLLAYIEESKTFAICDGAHWRKLVVGDVIAPEGTDTREGPKK